MNDYHVNQQLLALLERQGPQHDAITVQDLRLVLRRRLAAHPPEPLVLTETDIEAKVAGVQYALYGTLTVAVVTAQNTFRVVGESACLDPRRFDAETGRYLAYEKAKRQLWDLEGYLLRERLQLAGLQGVGR